IAAVASAPCLPPPNRRSISTTSTSPCALRVTASSPLAASATIRKSGSDSNTARNPARTTGWSSASNSRITASLTGPLALCQWNVDTEHRAGRRTAVHCDGATEIGRPLSHHRKSETVVGLLRRFGGIEADTVIGDPQQHCVPRILQRENRLIGSSVLRGVRQRGLCNT